MWNTGWQLSAKDEEGERERKGVRGEGERDHTEEKS